MGMLGKQMPPVENGRLDRLEKMLEGLMGGSVRKQQKSRKRRVETRMTRDRGRGSSGLRMESHLCGM
jgi:hypothetical protein